MQVPIEIVPRHARWMILLLTVGIFVVDLLTPVGLAVSVLYILPLLLTFFSERQRDPLYFFFAATVLWLVASGLVMLKRMQSDLLNAEVTKTKVMQDLLSERIE